MLGERYYLTFDHEKIKSGSNQNDTLSWKFRGERSHYDLPWDVN